MEKAPLMLFCCLFTCGKFCNDDYNACTCTYTKHTHMHKKTHTHKHTDTHARARTQVHAYTQSKKKKRKWERKEGKTNWCLKEPGDTVTDIKQQVIKSN